MKNFTLLLLALLFTSDLLSQTQADQKVVFVSCITGKVYVDGVLIDSVEADDAKTLHLSVGEHYVQVKNSTSKFNQTIKVESVNNGIIKIGCVEYASALESVSTERTVLVEKQLTLGGPLSNDIEQTAFALQENDELHLSAEVLSKNGTATLSILDYDRGNEIFRKELFTVVRDQTIRVPAKGIYTINVTSNALFNKSIRIRIERTAAASGDKNFKTSVRKVFDTLSTEVLSTTSRAYSINSGRSNRTTVRINLPARTSYWVYWIGVGQDAKNQMASFTSTLSNSAKLISANPLVLFGLSILKDLPMLKATSTVSYRFMDSQNSILFSNGTPFRHYTFKFADNVSTDFSLVREAPKDLVFCMWNNSSFTGQDVEIKIVAFQINTRLIMENE